MSRKYSDSRKIAYRNAERKRRELCERRKQGRAYKAAEREFA